MSLISLLSLHLFYRCIQKRTGKQEIRGILVDERKAFDTVMQGLLLALEDAKPCEGPDKHC